MLLPLVKVPNKILTTKTKPVKKVNEKVKTLIANMEETLVAQRDPEGVGLAATQIGLSISLFIMKPTKEAKTRAFINPKIEEVVAIAKPDSTKKDKSSLEGCLSIDRIWSPIHRPQKVRLSYLDSEGNKKSEWFHGFDAVIVQHEVDHLNGVLFTQRALEQNKKIFKEVNGELEPFEML